MDQGSTNRGQAPITRREVLLLLASGIALRTWWLVLVHGWTHPIFLGEATNVALAFARTGTLADSYFAGQGPTAHLLPTAVVLAGMIERAFGPESAAATVALGCWSICQVAVGFALATALFRRLGAGRAALLGGLGFLCLVPAPIASEAADFRVWEGALAFDLAAANLLWMAVLADRAAIRPQALGAGGALAAAAFFVNPPAGLGVVAAWTGFARLHLSRRQTAGWALTVALVLAAAVGPWTLRNEAALGAPVPLRSDFGLELAIANYDGALDPTATNAARQAHMQAVHQTRERLVAAGGEIAYSRAIGDRARQWIAAHPLGFLRLSLRHYRQFYVPDTWAEAATNWQGLDRPRIRLLQAVGILGLAGLATMVWRRRRAFTPLALYLAVTGLPYAIVQPIPRYGYLVYPLLVLLAAELIVSGLCRSPPPGPGAL